MFTIFTSPTKLVIESPIDPPGLLNKFRQKLGADDLTSCIKNAFSFSGECVGKVEERRITMRYISAISNPLKLAMLVDVETAGTGSVLRTKYTTSIFARAFITLWITLAVAFCFIAVFHLLPGSESTPIWFILAFPMYGVLLIVIMRLVARRDERKLEDFLRNMVG